MQIHSSLLNISVGAILIPVAYHFTLGSSSQDPTSAQARDILHMSHGVRTTVMISQFPTHLLLQVSIVLLISDVTVKFIQWSTLTSEIVYGAYLLFQLWSHTHLYHDDHNNKKSSRLSVKLPLEKPAIFRSTKQHPNRAVSPNTDKLTSSSESSPVNLSFPRRPYLQPLASASDLTLANTDPDINTRLTSVRVGGEYGVPLQRCESYYSEFRGSTYLHDRASPALAGDKGSLSTAPRTKESTIKEPQLSWQLTCILLVVVTVVSALCFVFHPSR